MGLKKLDFCLKCITNNNLFDILVLFLNFKRNDHATRKKEG